MVNFRMVDYSLQRLFIVGVYYLCFICASAMSVKTLKCVQLNATNVLMSCSHSLALITFPLA